MSYCEKENTIILPSFSDICSGSEIYTIYSPVTHLNSTIYIEPCKINNDIKIIKLENNDDVKKSLSALDNVVRIDIKPQIMEEKISKTIYLSSEDSNSDSENEKKINNYTLYKMNQPLNIDNKLLKENIEKINNIINNGVKNDTLKQMENIIIGYLEKEIKNINVDEIMELTRLVMEIIEMTKLKGILQKDLTINIIKRFIKEIHIEDDIIKEKMLNIINSGLIEKTIEIIVNASRGKYILNKVIDVVSTNSIGCCTIQ